MRRMKRWSAADCLEPVEHVSSIGFFRGSSLQARCRLFPSGSLAPSHQPLDAVQPIGHDRPHRKLFRKLLYTFNPSSWCTSGHGKIKQMRNRQNTFLTEKRFRLKLWFWLYTNELNSLWSDGVVALKNHPPTRWGSES
jgi:hypothetical protein